MHDDVDSGEVHVRTRCARTRMTPSSGWSNGALPPIVTSDKALQREHISRTTLHLHWNMDRYLRFYWIWNVVYPFDVCNLYTFNRTEYTLHVHLKLIIQLYWLCWLTLSWSSAVAGQLCSGGICSFSNQRGTCITFSLRVQPCFLRSVYSMTSILPTLISGVAYLAKAIEWSNTVFSSADISYLCVKIPMFRAVAELSASHSNILRLIRYIIGVIDTRKTRSIETSARYWPLLAPLCTAASPSPSARLQNSCISPTFESFSEAFHWQELTTNSTKWAVLTK